MAARSVRQNGISLSKSPPAGLITASVEKAGVASGAPMLARPITGMRRAGRLQGLCLESLLRLYSLTIFERIWIGKPGFAWIIIEDARHRLDRFEVKRRPVLMRHAAEARLFEPGDLIDRSCDRQAVMTPVRHCRSPSFGCAGHPAGARVVHAQSSSYGVPAKWLCEVAEA